MMNMKPFIYTLVYPERVQELHDKRDGSLLNNGK